MANLKKLLNLIKLEVKSGGKGEQPRDPTTGKFIAWDESAAAQHEQKDPEDFDVWSDPAIWGEQNPKLGKAGEGLSQFAAAIRGQVHGQIRQHGQTVASKMPASAKATNLYASYKHKPHSAPASIPKYLIHRIENFKQYQTPEGAKAADEDFIKRRDHAMLLSRVPDEDRARQMSIPELHASVVKAPHLIDEIMAHQQALHNHIRTRGKTKMMNGETHVALTRGLGAGGRIADPMLTSYADTHEVKLGDRVKQFHNHWVPLKNVWYSYDHGPKEAHPNHYFPAQDEFLVSPHELKNAMTSDVKKLVPRKPKESKPQPVSAPADQVPSSAPNVPGKLTASMSTNLFRLMKSFEPYGLLLQKSGQYIKIAPEILALAGGPRPDTKVRAQIKRQIGARGKIAPADMATLLQNHDLYVTEALLGRTDLTADQLKTIAKSPNGYSTTSDHHGKRKVQEVNDATFQKIADTDGDGSVVNDIVNTGNDNAISRLLAHAPNQVNGQHLFHMLMNRHDLFSGTMEKVIRHRDWDNSHMSEITSHPNPEVIKAAIRRDPGAVDPAVITRLATDPRPVVRAMAFQGGGVGGYASSETKPTPAQVMNALNDPDESVRTAAAGRVRGPEMVNEFINNHMRGPQNAAMVYNVLQNTRDPDQLRKITDYAIQHAPRLIADLSQKNELPTDSVNKILALPDNNTEIPPLENGYGYNTTMTAMKAGMLGRRNLDASTLAHALQNTNSPSAMKSISGRKEATPEIIRGAWQKMPKDSTGYNEYHGFATNRNTPTDVLSEMASTPNVMLHTSRQLIQHPNLAPTDLQHFVDSEDPNVRALAATNPNATSEQISKGIQDKSKDVRRIWLQHGSMGPEHFAVALKDKAPTNRARLMSHLNATPEMLKHAITKDKAEIVRQAALNNRNITPELVSHVALNDPSEDLKLMALQHSKAPASLINSALESNPSVALAQVLRSRVDLTGPQTNKIYGVIQQAIENLTPEDRAQENNYNSKVKSLKALRGHYLNTDSATPEMLNDFINRSTMADVRDTLGDRVLDSINTAQFKGLYDRSIAHGQAAKAAWIVANPGRESRAPTILNDYDSQAFLRHPKAAEAGILQEAANSPDEYMRQKAAQSKGITAEIANKLAADPSTTIRQYVAHNSATPASTLQAMVHTHMAPGPAGDSRHVGVADYLASNPNTPADALNALFGHAEARIREHVVNNPNAPESVIDRALRDDHNSVKKIAGEKIAHVKPDQFNISLPDAHTTEVHPATEKLKFLKGKVMEMGGNVNKNQLPNKGQGLPGQLFDGKGNISGDSIDKYLKTLPHANYNVSYGDWNSSQRHSKDPQKVVQINMTDDHVRQLKEQGLLDTFKKLHKKVFSSGHPVKQHTLGWARVDQSHPGHWHIDEIQSDFGQGTIRQIEKLKDEGRGADLEREFGMPPEQLSENLKKIIKVFSGPFKNINHAIHAVVHQDARDKGVTSTSMDTLNDQAKQSGMRDVGVEGGRALPGHMINTYDQIPKDMGYETKPKKDVMPNSVSNYGETEVQQRKLTKALDKLKELKEKLKKSDSTGKLAGNLTTVTHGRHTAAPATEAGGKYAPVAKKPSQPAQHVRADTMTHQNLHYELGKSGDAAQYHVDLGLPVSKQSTGSYAQWHLTKQQLGHILKHWDKVGWDMRGSSRPSEEGKFHSTAITRNKLSKPLQGYLEHNKPKGKILYHGVGRDEMGAKALKADKFDPYHPDEAVRQAPKGPYDEIHSHYTLNVVDKPTGFNILKHIHGLMKDTGKAVISVRRDLPPAKLNKKIGLP